MVPAPVETVRRPWRVPGCDGAKVRETVQMPPAVRMAGQLVVSVKSPVRVRDRSKGCAPVLAMVTFCGMLEVAVTRMGLGKVMVAGVTLRFGFVVVPVAPGRGMVLPVMRTERSLSQMTRKTRRRYFR